jgi:hypothetical protein
MTQKESKKNTSIDAENKLQQTREAKSKEYFKNTKALDFEKKIDGGGFGYVRVFSNDDGTLKVAQKLEHNNENYSTALKNEATKTKQFGNLGALAREVRRMTKGYDTEMRFPSPYVFETEKKFVMEYMEKGSLKDVAKKKQTISKP